MNQEPDAGVLDADTEEWQLPEADGDDSAVPKTQEQTQAVADEGGWGDPAEPADEEAWHKATEQAGENVLPEPAELTGEDVRHGPAEPANAVTAARVQPRHARPRDLRRLATTVLAVALVIAVGFALYFWLQLDSARGKGDTLTPAADDLGSELEQANTRLAETEQELREAQVRVVDAEAEARELQEQLDATIAASADADDELAEAAEQLRAVTDSLAAAQSEGEALASAVLGSVDPVDACVRATAQVAENVDQIGRGQLARQARDAAATCAAAQESLGPAVGQARGVLAD